MKHFNFTKWALLPVVAIVMLSTGACKKINYYQLSDADMEWLVYQNNQIVTFKSGPETVKIHVGLRQKSYYDYGADKNEWTAAYLGQLNDTTAFDKEDSYGYLNIIKQNTGLLVTLSWPHFPLKEVPLTGVPFKAVVVNGFTYTDVVVLNGSNWTSARNYNRKVWYSKSTGVIQYEDVNGDLWVLQQ